MLAQVMSLIPCRRFSFKAGPPLGMIHEVNPSLEASKSLCSKRDTARSSPPKPAQYQIQLHWDLLCHSKQKEGKGLMTRGQWIRYSFTSSTVRHQPQETNLARPRTPCRWAQAVPWCCWLWPPQGPGRWQAQTPALGQECITNLLAPLSIEVDVRPSGLHL